jgi:phage terminase large subunit GpA-like protein
MTAARRSTTVIPNARAHLYRALANAVRPRPLLTVSAWADAHRVLTSKGSSEPGPWRTDRAPYLRDIMTDLSAHSPVQRIVLRFGSQVGKTEVALNWLGYIMDRAPAPVLVVVPTLEVRKRWVKQRLDPLLNETPVIAALFDNRRRRDSGNSEDMKDFPGGLLVLAGANSPASLASMPIKYVICDEVDRFPWEAGAEGDPLGLIDERTKTFPRRKVLLVSTPTVAGLSRIDDEYQAGDQREYYVPCPHCGQYQTLHWTHPDGAPGLIHHKTTGAIYYRCVHCAERIDEHHKTALLAAGQWRPRYPERPIRSYTLSGLYSPLGLGFTWTELWASWQDAHGDTAKLKRFVNTTLGEVWQEQGDSVDPVGLIAKLEDYPDSLPVGVRALGIDIQKDRIEISVIDWGAGEEAWLQDHLILPGDTALPHVWEDLVELLGDLRPDAVGIDCGYHTSQVYAFVEKRPYCYALKGIAGPGRALIEDERVRRAKLRKKQQRRAVVYPVGVDQAKALIYARLKLPAAGPGAFHFPRTPSFDDEYFAQLAAEKLVTKTRGTRAYAEWVQTRPRNEALDCAVYALAALRLSGLDPARPVNAPAPAARPAPPPPARRSNSFVNGWR